jgi:carbamoyl-phosphate synthase small subunit
MTTDAPAAAGHAGDSRAAPPALLVLEDGTVMRGTAFGAEGETFGEMVFNTGMTGYQETLTDPSYARQIVAMTAPHIGNTGVNDEDPESRRIWVGGYVVREPARLDVELAGGPQTWTTELRNQGITGIAIRGTRALTRRLREHGAMRAAISHHRSG